MDTNEQVTSSEEQKVLPTEPVRGEEGAPVKPVEGATKGEGEATLETPTPRTYGEEEWNKRQSSWDTQTDEAEKRHKVELEKVQTEFESTHKQLQEQQTAAFLKQVEADGGDVDAAKKVRGMEVQLANERRTLDKEKFQVFESMRRIDAHRLAQEHKIDEEPLLKANSFEEMKSLAFEAALEKAKSEQKPPVVVDKGIPSGKGTDLSNMTIPQRLRWLAEQGKI